MSEDAEPEAVDFETAYTQLTGIAEVLRTQGLNVREDMLRRDLVREQWDDGDDFPIVSDGSEGIRVIPSETGFSVWYTNGFEDIESATVLSIREALRTGGFETV